MKQISFNQVTNRHIDELVENMRPADLDELDAATSLPIRDVIAASVKHSALSATVMVDGEVACILGVCPVSILGGHGIPWMLGTKVVDRNAKSLWKTLRPVCDEIQEAFSFLENYVDARNLKAIRVLKAMGFNVEPAKPWGHKGLPFHRFTRG